jgi:AcrR family transcriptional regulator
MTARAPKQPATVRRRTILEAAHEVFSESSFQNADTAELAEAAGVKPAALYRYFPSKRDLYLATLEEASPRLLGLWKEAASQSGDALEAMWDIGMAYYDHTQSRSPVMRLWFQALSEASDPAVRGTIARTFTGAVDLLAANIDRGKAEGVVRAEIDSRIAAWHFMAVGLAFDLLHILGLDAELDRSKAEQWGRLYIDAVRAVRPATQAADTEDVQ